MNTESLKGHLDLLLLAVVSAGAAHCYLIARGLAEASGGSLDLPEGTLGPVALTLILVALLASAVPAWRASEVDPAQALREE